MYEIFKVNFLDWPQSRQTKIFRDVKMSNSRTSCTVNGDRRSLLKVVWVTK